MGLSRGTSGSMKHRPPLGSRTPLLKEKEDLEGALRWVWKEGTPLLASPGKGGRRIFPWVTIGSLEPC